MRPDQFRDAGERLVSRNKAFAESDRLRVTRYRHTWLPVVRLRSVSKRFTQVCRAIAPWHLPVFRQHATTRWHPASRPYRVISGAADVYELRRFGTPRAIQSG